MQLWARGTIVDIVEVWQALSTTTHSDLIKLTYVSFFILAIQTIISYFTLKSNEHLYLIFSIFSMSFY